MTDVFLDDCIAMRHELADFLHDTYGNYFVDPEVERMMLGYSPFRHRTGETRFSRAEHRDLEFDMFNDDRPMLEESARVAEQLEQSVELIRGTIVNNLHMPEDHFRRMLQTTMETLLTAPEGQDNE